MVLPSLAMLGIREIDSRLQQYQNSNNTAF
jgi:hypothetical protein